MGFDLATAAAGPAAELKARGQTIAVAESSTGGLLSAALLAVPGASAYYLGGTVIYTIPARRDLLGVPAELLKRQTPLTEDYVLLCAKTIRERMKATWGIAELGATGPAATPYGHPPGICVLAIDGPVSRAVRLETGHGDRVANMHAFTTAALALLGEALAASR